MTTPTTYTTMPAEDPARYAWLTIEQTYGEPLELTFLEEFEGVSSGFWRCRFHSRKENKVKVVTIGADSLASLEPDRLAALKELRERASAIRRRIHLLHCRLQAHRPRRCRHSARGKSQS